MSPNELAAFNAGIRHAADMALISAITLEVRPGIAGIRSRAAVAALQGLAEGLKASTEEHPAAVEPSPAVSSPAADRESATAQGFTGDACTTCGAFQMRRVGTCLTCQACGSTTGCS